MRIVLKTKPKGGDTRIKSGFLWFPKIIQNEIRWLEYATWHETYYQSVPYWDADKWIDYTKNDR